MEPLLNRFVKLKRDINAYSPSHYFKKGEIAIIKENPNPKSRYIYIRSLDDKRSSGGCDFKDHLILLPITKAWKVLYGSK